MPGTVIPSKAIRASGEPTTLGLLNRQVVKLPSKIFMFIPIP